METKDIENMLKIVSVLKKDEAVKDEKHFGFLNEYVIIRTYCAGVWFGKLTDKSSDEVILTEARRMFDWKAVKSISLSGVAKYGIVQDESRICPALSKVWLQAIEILTLKDVALNSIKNCPDAEAR